MSYRGFYRDRRQDCAGRRFFYDVSDLPPGLNLSRLTGRRTDERFDRLAGRVTITKVSAFFYPKMYLAAEASDPELAA